MIKTIRQSTVPTILVIFLGLMLSATDCCKEFSADFSCDCGDCNTNSIVEFTNTSLNADGFEWDFGDGATSGEENPDHRYTEPGTYQVKLKATNARCSDEAIKTVTITEPLLWEKNEIYSSNYPAIICVEDMNQDGDPDILLSGFGSDQVLYFENNLPSDFIGDVIDSELQGPIGIDAADFNSDGNLDIAVAAWPSNTVAWFRNTGESPISWEKIIIDDDFTEADVLTAEDLDGDGDPDIVASGAVSDLVVWYENNLPSDWTRNTIATIDLPEIMETGDLDNDGDQDIVVTGTNEGLVCCFFNNLPSGSWLRTTVESNFLRPSGVSLADIDDDGDLDIAASDLTASGNNIKAAWYENGNNWTMHEITSGLGGIRTLDAKDIDGDGRTDILVADMDNGDVVLFRNKDKGKTWTKELVDVSLAGANSVCAADIDGDSYMEILATAKVADKTVWYKYIGE